jgi:hypothetical protein
MKMNVLLYAVICLLLFKNCTIVTTPSPADTTACSYNGISRDELVEMIRAYDKGQLANVNNGMRQYIDKVNRRNGVYDPGNPSSFEDARTVFFKLDTLQQFFNAVKCKVTQNGLQRDNGTPILPSDIGVRIYYTAYPGLTGSNGIAINEETKKGRHTLVFVATYSDTDSTNIDFDPTAFEVSEKTGYKVPQRLDNPKIPGSEKRYFALFSGPDDPSYGANETARNHGELCPPPKGCGTVLTNLADALPTSER